MLISIHKIRDDPRFDKMKHIRLLIFGKVQGVFFRASTLDKAQKLQITGWVRNNKEGTVEILASGTDDQLKALMAWCKKGPPNANVTKIEYVTIEQNKRLLPNFFIAETF